ncbi:hypothetical protein MUK42_05447 [Musa troglodytarum]|uniref:Uncharacterized protein n=1 Tax=Musa troglodytarum TaxID=320322 RepID=A0A9E7JEG4_9LILI|nr:hypothetical protein MUK42_05447 [Musa troglodytarum]URD78103.1 hypothetical protein MUK42_05447 [Musa troglodytarum]
MILKTIVLVKLQEGQTTKYKKEKKRKRKDKKDEVNVEPVNSQYLGKSQENNKYEEKSLSNQKVRFSRKTSKDALEHMEKSVLTEEHDSPESSQDSNKRRKLASSVCSHNKLGTILRIKLSRQRDAEPPLPSSRKTEPELLLPSSRQGNPQLPSPRQTVVAVDKSEQIADELPAADEQPCSSGRDVETGLNQETAVTLHRTSGSKRIGRRTWQKEQFRDLIADWNPPLLQLESWDDGGEDWLCGAPKRHSSLYADEGKKATTQVSSVRVSYMSSSQQPRACYLPEFDMYQLPYEVPF